MAYNGPLPQVVNAGGTGRATLTNHGVLVGAGTSAISQTATGASASTVLIGNGASADPTFSATPQLTALGIGAAAGASGLTFDGTSILSTYNSFSSFTPALQFGGASVGITYSIQGGIYIKIGQCVYISIYLSLSSKGSSTGTATISGLPFTVANNANYNPVITCIGSLITLGVGFTTLFFNPNINTTIGTIGVGGGAVATGAAALSDTAFANNSTIYINGFYFASS